MAHLHRRVLEWTVYRTGKGLQFGEAFGKWGFALDWVLSAGGGNSMMGDFPESL